MIQGNTTTLTNADNKVVNANLCLDGMTEIDLVSLSDLKTDSSIGITIIIDCEPLSFTSNGAKTDAQYFFSDSSAHGVTYVTDHLELAHNFTYSAAGAVLTATCGETTCALKGKTTILTLKAPENLVYDGSTKTCTIDAEDSWTTTAGLNLPTIEYYQGGTKLSGAPTNVGTYTAKITEGTATAEVDFEITQKPVIVTALDASVDTSALVKIREAYQKKYPGKAVTVAMKVSDTDVNAADVAKIQAAVGNKKLITYDASLVVEVDGELQSEAGDQNTELIKITYKFDFTEKANLQTYRVHNGVVDELTETANAKGEFVKYDKDAGTITVTACKYSTYGFAYDEVADSPNTGITSNSTVLPAVVGLIVLAVALTFVVIRRRRAK